VTTDSARVTRDLVAFGRQLEAQGAAQAGDGFTGRPDADALLESDPNAFLLGVLFTQGIAAERAWAGPFELLRRLGSIEPVFLAAHADQVRAAVQAPPMLHRFKETLPRWISSAGRRLAEEYAGNASQIWPSGDHVLAVTDRLSALDGIGRKKAVMAVEILTRHFGVRLRGREHGQVAYDVHVRRVFVRSGLADVDTCDAIEAAATRACPDAPGTIDLAAWLIGRNWCRPRSPRCDACRLSVSCARRVTLTPEGVGVRKHGGPAREPYSAERKTDRRAASDRSSALLRHRLAASATPAADPCGSVAR